MKDPLNLKHGHCETFRWVTKMFGRLFLIGHAGGLIGDFKNPDLYNCFKFRFVLLFCKVHMLGTGIEQSELFRSLR